MLIRRHTRRTNVANFGCAVIVAVYYRHRSIHCREIQRVCIIFGEQDQQCQVPRHRGHCPNSLSNVLVQFGENQHRNRHNRSFEFGCPFSSFTLARVQFQMRTNVERHYSFGTVTWCLWPSAMTYPGELFDIVKLYLKKLLLLLFKKGVSLHSQPKVKIKEYFEYFMMKPKIF